MMTIVNKIISIPFWVGSFDSIELDRMIEESACVELSLVSKFVE